MGFGGCCTALESTIGVSNLFLQRFCLQLRYPLINDFVCYRTLGSLCRAIAGLLISGDTPASDELLTEDGCLRIG